MTPLLFAMTLALAAGPPANEPVERSEVAARLAALFPAARLTHTKTTGSKRPIVAPVHRGKRVGYAHNILGVKSGGVLFIAFELRLVDKAEGADSGTHAADIVSRVANTRKVHQVVALIALDKRGKVIGKPEGWPLEADVDEEIVGNLAVLQYVRLLGLTKLKGTSPGAIVEYQHDGDVSLLAFVAHRKGQTRSAPPFKTRSLVSGADCWVETRATAEQLKCDVDLTVTERCEADAEQCAEFCRDAGLAAGPRVRRQTWLAGVCPRP